MAKASPARGSAPATPAAAPSTPGSGASSEELSSFVRDAIREKAARELAAIETRAAAIEATTKAKGDLEALIASFAAASSALTSSADVTSGVPAKLKRVRKALDEALSLTDQLAEAVGGSGDRANEVSERRAEIEKALAAAGLSREDLAPKAAPAPEPAREPESEPAADADA